MKKLFILCLLFSSTTLLAEGLEGYWHSVSNSSYSNPNRKLTASISKSNVFLINVSEAESGSATYATKESDYNHYDSNCMLCSCVMRIALCGKNIDLDDEGYLFFNAKNGNVENFRLQIAGINYYFERDKPIKQSSPQKTSVASSSSTFSSNKSQNSYSNNSCNYTTPQETRIQNINATYGYKGVWLYEFTNYGTFRDHNCTYNEYGRVVRENGSLSGTYYLTKDSNGTIRVYLRYDNGRQKQGYIRYKNHTSEFSLDRKTSWEM